MGRARSVPGGRPVRVSVPLSKAEKALLDGLVAQTGKDAATVMRTGLELVAATTAKAGRPE